ncbi:MAG: PQQ-dependent sugar dehydrogenase [Phycisphaeraceae bacterium]|nr:PQQ-dependent sugar dehydrogenase [Phycisphaeraceae bacterium]
MNLRGQIKCCVIVVKRYKPVLALALAWLVLPADAQHFPDIQQGTTQVRLELYADGLAGSFNGEFQVTPTDLVPFGDGSGRLAVSTLGGITRVIDGGGNLLNTALLTKAQSGTQVPGNGEWGMTSIAFHPDFGKAGAAGYGRFYTITTENPSGTPTDFGSDNNHQDILTEWTLADHSSNSWGSAGDTSREIMRVGQPGQPHNVVDLAFGPDKTLYISSGDGGANPTESQDPSTIFGNILRIDPLGNNSSNGRYGIPSDNPYANGETVTAYLNGDRNGQTVDPLDEVYAYGFRSPFRMNFDGTTGKLYVGDVGQSDVEEINVVVAGGNYGWNSKEGSLRSGQNLGCCRVEEDTPSSNNNGAMTLAEEFSFIDPLFEYDHDEGLSISGGFVYRGSLIPELQGMYVFGDLGERQPTARLFYGDPDATDTTDFHELLIDPEGDLFFGFIDNEARLLPERLISLGEDENGELYLVAVGRDPRAGGGVAGQIIRIVPEPNSLVLLGGLGGLLLSVRRRCPLGRLAGSNV